MTSEEFEKLEDKWQTVYIDGRTPIRMVSKRSSKKDCILWYDDECSHTIHYSRITLELSDSEKELDSRASKYADAAKRQKFFDDRVKYVAADFAYKCYHIGATEQRKIDIAKAIEWLKETQIFEHPDYKHSVPFFTKDDIEEFKKFMMQ